MVNTPKSPILIKALCNGKFENCIFTKLTFIFHLFSLCLKLYGTSDIIGWGEDVD